MSSVVLNPRAVDQAEELNRLLRAAELTPLSVPTVEVIPGWSEEQLALIRDGLRAHAYAWMVLPSANAARFLLQALEQAGGGPEDLLGTQIVAGAATAQILADRDVLGVEALERFSAKAALAFLLDQQFEGRVLLPGAAEGRDEILEGLQKGGRTADPLVLYQTRLADPKSLHVLAATFARGDVSAVLFTSPSTVRGLVEGMRALHFEPARALRGTLLVCIGDTTAEAVRGYGLVVSGIAERTNLESLVQAAVSLLNEQPLPPGDLVGGLAR